MDVPVKEDDLKPQSDGSPLIVTEKRRRDEGGSVPLAKRMRRVAEIVLVLSGLSEMRGGAKKPTEEETELMREARLKLAEMCDEFSMKPLDLVGGKDAAGAVIKDLGLMKNGRFKDTPPRLSIKEKLLASKPKMEESRKFVVPNAYASSIENRGKPNPGLASTVGFSIPKPPALKPPALHAPTTTTPSTGSLPRPAVTTGFSGSNSGRESSSLAVPRVEKPQHRMDGGVKVYHSLPVQANSSVNHAPVPPPPAWPAIPQPASSVRARSENKVPNPIPSQVGGSVGPRPPGITSQASRDQNVRQSITQPTPTPSPNQSVQGTNFAQPPSIRNSPNNIAKIVQRLLQPKVPQNPIWTPPSREYMNRQITCQTCAITINDVESVLLCDACEKGFHIKCIPNLKGIPRDAEWHCSKCLVLLTQGKTLPPKYGRVMRSTNTPNVLPNITGVVQEPLVKKPRPLDPKGNQSLAGSGSLEKNTIGLRSNSNISNVSIVHENDLSEKNVDHIPSSGKRVEDSTQTMGPAVGSSSEEPALINQNQLSEPTKASESKSDQMPSSGDCVDDSTQSLGPTSGSSSEKSDPTNQNQLESTKGSESKSSGNRGGDSKQPFGPTFGSSNGSSSEKSAQMTQNLLSEPTSVSEVKQPSTMLPTRVHIQPSEIPQSIQTGLLNPAEVLSGNASDNNSVLARNITSGSGTGLKEHVAQENPVENSEPVTGLPNSAEVLSEKPPDNNSDLASNVTSEPNIGLKEHVALENHVEKSESVTELANGVPSDGLHSVEWIGKVFEISNEKKIYQSCCVDGVTYKVQDHALFRSSHEKLIPSKLQSMWEDSKTGSKWIIVKKCYFPGDLPQSVAQPSKPENNEVYESTNDSTLVPGLIQGPCEVLHPSKFEEKQSQSQPESNQGAHPIFLCKWQFDEIKGTFQPVSS